MRFLLFTWGVPLVMFAAYIGLISAGVESPLVFVLGVPATVWLYANIPITLLYLLSRVVWRARRDARN